MQNCFKAASVAAITVMFLAPASAQERPGTGTAYERAGTGIDSGWKPIPLPASAFGFDRTPKSAVVPFSHAPDPVIAPALADAIRNGAPSETVEVIVVFRDEVKVPFFPKLDPRYSRNEPENQRLQAQRDDLVARLTAQREPKYRERSTALAALGVKTRETFWLSDMMILTSPLSAIAAIAARPDVRRIALSGSALPPFVASGRARINSDPLFNDFAVNGGFAPHIAVLDTGSPMPLNHVQFGSRTRIELEKDCYYTTSSACTQQLGNTQWDPHDACNHGTSTAAILTALDAQGGAYRGVTAFQLGTYDVYDSVVVNGGCHTATAATVRGIAAAVADGYPIMLVETQFVEGETDPVVTQANNAFIAGVAVIATNGNGGPAAATVNSPALGHNVIGVGARNFNFDTTLPDQSLGPAPDLRVKPDIQAPSDTLTASSDNSTAVRQFGGTSGAGPFAAGAAALLGAFWNRSLSWWSYVVAPGQLYAGLIDSGLQTNFNNTEGAGRIRLMQPDWTAGHGQVTLGQQQYVDIYTPQVPVGVTVKAAIWWSDPSVGQHSDMDLSLFGYAGTFPSRNGIPEVFEKVSYGPVQSPSIWTIRIIGYNVPTGSQQVFYSWHVVPQ